MAIHADTIWEVRASGNNNNGGGWRDGGGGSVDYSQQDVAELNLSNCSVSGTTLTDDDAGGAFTAAMVWNIVNIVGDERRQITAFVDTNNVTLDAAPGDASGLTINVGGAVASLEDIDGSTPLVLGNIIYIKSGTYVLSTDILWTSWGNSTTPYKIIGYNISRGDDPTGNDRPFLDGGVSYTLRIGKWWEVSNIRLESEAANSVYAAKDNCIIRNCYIHNDSPSAGRDALYFAAGGSFVVDCELVSDNGRAVYLWTNCHMIGCYVHDSIDGVGGAASGTRYVGDCIFDTISGTALLSNNVLTYIRNTFYNCNVAVNIGGNTDAIVRNSQFVNCGTGVVGSASNRGMLDYNNYYNNTLDIAADIEKGTNATANDPGFADAPGGDFSGVDDADGFTIRLGVG